MRIILEWHDGRRIVLDENEIGALAATCAAVVLAILFELAKRCTP